MSNELIQSSPKWTSDNLKLIPGASKIEASGVQNGLLEASWGLLEAKSAKDGRTSPPKPASGRLLGRPEALPKWSWGILGGSWGRLGPPGEPPGRLRNDSRSRFWPVSLWFFPRQ